MHDQAVYVLDLADGELLCSSLWYKFWQYWQLQLPHPVGSRLAAGNNWALLGNLSALMQRFETSVHRSLIQAPKVASIAIESALTQSGKWACQARLVTRLHVSNTEPQSEEAMETLEKYLNLVKHMTSVAFAKQESGTFLLKRPTENSKPADGPEQISFDTVYATVQVDPFADQWCIVPVKKRDGNPYEDRISIGRASNCDLVLRVPFISKVQAHILCESDGTYALRANNSANPTLLNNRPIGPGSVCPLKVADEIQFGPMKFEFVDAQRLYKVLTAEVRSGQV